MKIRNLNVSNNVILAPMAGVSDLSFRVLCQRLGCELVYSEMVSAKAIVYNNVKTKQLYEIHPEEKKVAIQLFGNEPATIAEAAKRIDNENISIFDVNMGCPVPKVVNNHEGSALMMNPKLAGEIIYALSRAVNKPVTAKIRLGFTQENKNAVEVARILEAHGADAIAVHGRTRDMYYSGQADWEMIRSVKDALCIPVIGNGDVSTPEAAKRMLEETGCDGVMVARAAQGNPWIYGEINTYLQTGQIIPRPSLDEIVAMIKEHLSLLVAHKGEFIAIREMRKHVAWYTKGLNHGVKLRQAVNQVETIDGFYELLQLILT